MGLPISPPSNCESRASGIARRRLECPRGCSLRLCLLLTLLEITKNCTGRAVGRFDIDSRFLFHVCNHGRERTGSHEDFGVRLSWWSSRQRRAGDL